MCGQAYSIDVIRLANQGWTSQHAHRKGMDNFHFLSPNRGIDTEGVHESRFGSSQSDAIVGPAAIELGDRYCIAEKP